MIDSWLTHDSWLMYSQESEDEGKGDTSEGEASEAPKAKKQTAPKMPEKKKKKAENGREPKRRTIYYTVNCTELPC